MGWTQWLARLPRGAFEVSFSRSGGPGGQNVNKVSTKAQIRLPGFKLASLDSLSPELKKRLVTESSYATKHGDILISSELTRSQKLNTEDCFEKLAKELERLSFVPAEPSIEGVRKWKKLAARNDAKRKEKKKFHSQKKQDRKVSY